MILAYYLKKNLKFDEHINNTVKKVNRIISLIKGKEFLAVRRAISLNETLILFC